MELPEISPEQAWKEYRRWQEAFDKAGIPWNRKGSPHALRLKALHFLRQTNLRIIVSETIKMRMPELAANITANNALLRRLTSR